MNKHTFLFMLFIMLLMCGFFVWRLLFPIEHSYEGYVIDRTKDSLILEVEVEATPEELIGYEAGDPYTIGGK